MNMDYCKYENTYVVLRQCADDWQETPSSKTEVKAKEGLMELMKEILMEAGYKIDEPEED